jgi:hypothetical protein
MPNILPEFQRFPGNPVPRFPGNIPPWDRVGADGELERVQDEGGVYDKTADRMSEVDQSDKSNGMMKDAEDTAGMVDDGLQDDSIDVEDGIDQSDQSNGAENDTSDGGMNRRMSMSTRKASEGDGVGDDDEEEESMNRGDKKEDKESTRGGAEAEGDVRIRKKILESVREKFDNVQEESFRKRINLEGSRNEDDRKQTGSLRSGSSGSSLTLTTTLKREVIEMKQGREEENSSMIGVDKLTGQVEGFLMWTERMLTAGDDLNRERER